MKCTFCKSQSELSEVESPAIRLCSFCRNKLKTYIAVICTCCNTLYWLPKTAGNVEKASEMSGQSPVEIMDNPVIHEIKSCKKCYENEFTVQGAWKQ